MTNFLGIAILALIVIVTIVIYNKQQSVALADQSEFSTGGSKELTLEVGKNVTLKLVRIPAGKFMMGSPKTEVGRDNDEIQHEVTISKPFYIGTTHVTVDQFAVFILDSGYKTDAEKGGGSSGLEVREGKHAFKRSADISWRKPSFNQHGNHPVVQVSWNDAQAFCNWLSKKSGKMIALPTEAQWEYACRAGTKTAYPWGDDPDGGNGWENCSDQSLKKMLPNELTWKFFAWDDGFAFTSPVGSFKANAFGLYDMIGNAMQWCQDGSGRYTDGAVTDPTGAVDGNIRVLRGGSWRSNPANCRSARRGGSMPAGRDDNFGFRIVIAPGGE
jgi:sulfatase modifying factor 1